MIFNVTGISAEEPFFFMKSARVHIISKVLTIRIFFWETSGLKIMASKETLEWPKTSLDGYVDRLACALILEKTAKS